MNEEIDIYLCIFSNKFIIYVFDSKNLINLYVDELKLENTSDEVDLNNLNKFLEKNIFKIEKKINKFIQNIFLIIENKNITSLDIGVKRNSYQETINKKTLENTLVDLKSLIKKNYQDKKIIHIIVNEYLVNGKSHSLNEENLNGDYFCLDIRFKLINNSFALEIEKVLEKYQIKSIKFLDGKYVKNFFKYNNIEISEMINKILNGINENEVKLVQKIQKKSGFFEKFFQLFS